MINDIEHTSLAAASSKSLKMTKGNDKKAATAAGKALGEAAKAKVTHWQRLAPQGSSAQSPAKAGNAGCCRGAALRAGGRPGKA